MAFTTTPVSLSDEEKVELRHMSQSRILPAGDVMKARMILLLSEGKPIARCQQQLLTTAPTISTWEKRFLKDGIAGLMETRHPGQTATVITPKLQARVLEATRREPKDGSTHGPAASWPAN